MGDVGRPAIGKPRPIKLPADTWTWLGEVGALSDVGDNRSEIIRRCIDLARQLQRDDPAEFYRRVMDPSSEGGAPTSGA